MKPIKKKSQIAGEAFIYILAIVIFALILIFGYSAIQDFLKKGERIAFVQFKTTLENEVKTITTDYGSVTIFNAKNPLTLPSKYKEVCFIDYDYKGYSSTGICTDGDINYRPIICDSWKKRIKQNVFLDPIAEMPIFIPNLKPEVFECIQSRKGRIDIRLEGFGSYTKISKYEEQTQT